MRMQESSQSVWIVIPSFNEGARLGKVLERLTPLYPQVIVIDDGSSDNSAEVARAAGAVVLKHGRNRGQGAALRSGIQEALRLDASVIVTFDADGQHQTSDIAPLIEPLLKGEAEIVLGSRFKGSSPGIPFKRRFLLKCALLFTRVTTGLRLTDTHNGLRALSRKAAQQIELTFDGPEHASEILEAIRIHQLKYREIPVTIAYTADSLQKSPKGWRYGFKIAGQMLFWRFSNSKKSAPSLSRRDLQASSSPS